MNQRALLDSQQFEVSPSSKRFRQLGSKHMIFGVFLLQSLFLKHASGCFFVPQKEGGNGSPGGECWLETSPWRQLQAGQSLGLSLRAWRALGPAGPLARGQGRCWLLACVLLPGGAVLIVPGQVEQRTPFWLREPVAMLLPALLSICDASGRGLDVMKRGYAVAVSIAPFQPWRLGPKGSKYSPCPKVRRA